MIFYRLSESFGWTPQQIVEMSPRQALLYIRLLNLGQHEGKVDKSSRYATFPTVEAAQQYIDGMKK